VAAPAIVAVAGLLVAAHQRRSVLSTITATLAIMAAGVAVGATAATPPSAAMLADHPRGLAGPWRVRGRLATDPQSVAPNSLVDLDIEEIMVGADWLRLPLRARATVYEPASGAWRTGDQFEAFLAFRADRPAANPEVPPRQPLRASGIDLRSSLKSFRQLRRRPTSRWPSIRRMLAPARQWVRGAADRGFDGDAPFVKALILGERGDLPPEQQQEFARSGLIHLLAISGLHVGLVVAALFVGARVAGAAAPLSALACLLALPLISAMVVPRPAVARAVLMAAALLVALVVGRRPDALNGLALASLLLTASDPWVTRNLGYQLSTAATGAILLVVGSTPRPPRSDDESRLRSAVRGAFAVSAAAQIGVAPLLAATSFRIPAATVLVNPVAVPLLGLSLAATCLALGVAAVVSDAAAAPWIVVSSWAFAGLRAVSKFADTLPLSLPVPASLVTTVAAASFAALTGVVFWRGRRPLPIAVSVAVLLASCGVGWWTIKGQSSHGAQGASLRLVVFDIGQGDSLLVETPAAEHVVIDTGGSPGSKFDTGASILAPALRARGVRRLDAVAITHFHADHAGGLAGLLRELPVGRIWTGSVSMATPEVRRLVSEPSSPAVVGLAAGHERAAGDCSWRVLHPSGEFLASGGSPPANDASLVLRLRCGTRQLVLSGDAEAPSERVWSAFGLAGSGVLKVPHHGSTTSSSEPLLSALDGVRHAAISVGWRNRFSLPDPEVLERYRRRSIAVYRTDRDGALTFSLGRRIRVRGERWTSGAGRYRIGGWLH